jgi:chromosome segregation ATPase
MQERLNALDYLEADAATVQRLRTDITALRQQAGEREQRVGQLQAELAAVERTVGTLRRERTDRTEELEVDAVRQLADVQAEHDAELQQCRDIIAGQEEQLGQLDQAAAGALEAKAEVLRLVKENKELAAKALSLQVSGRSARISPLFS